MSEWKEYKLTDVCQKIGSGATPRGGQEAYLSDGEYALIRSQNVLDFYFTMKGLAFINEAQASKLKNVEIKERDILLNITGDSVARVCQVPSNILPARVNQHVAIIRPNPDIINNEYLKYYLLEPKVKDYLLMISSSGGTRNAITKNMLEELVIQLPDLPTQTAIAEILSSLDDKIELNNKINQELENLAQTLFKQWFIDFEFPNENGEPYKSSGGEMAESELGEIPKGWEVYRFKDIVSNYIDNRGKTPPLANDGIPLVEVKHMVDIGIYPSLKTDKFLSKEVYDTFLRAHLLEDDILMSTVGTIGRLNIVPDFQIFAIAQNVLGIRFKKDLISQLFMFCLMRTKGFNDEINSRLIETVQSSIKRSDLEKIPVILPKRILVERFDDIVKDMFDRIKTSSSEIDELINLRDILLPKLISGELEVSQTQTTA